MVRVKEVDYDRLARMWLCGNGRACKNFRTSQEPFTWCFVLDKSSIHYRVQANELSVWAAEIKGGKATYTNPPSKLLMAWTQKQYGDGGGAAGHPSGQPGNPMHPMTGRRPGNSRYPVPAPVFNVNFNQVNTPAPGQSQLYGSQSSSQPPSSFNPQSEYQSSHHQHAQYDSSQYGPSHYQPTQYATPQYPDQYREYSSDANRYLPSQYLPSQFGDVYTLPTSAPNGTQSVVPQQQTFTLPIHSSSPLRQPTRKRTTSNTLFPANQSTIKAPYYQT